MKPLPWNDFDQSDILISGGSLSDYLNSDGNISFNIIPDASATEVEISLAEGAGNFAGDNTLPADIQILLVPPVPGKSDLLSWWWLDEGTGTKVTDSIGGGFGGYIWWCCLVCENLLMEILFLFKISVIMLISVHLSLVGIVMLTVWVFGF
jgi:hypothetical protein